MARARTAIGTYDEVRRTLDTMAPQETLEAPVSQIGPPRPEWVSTRLGIPYRDTRQQWRDGVYHIHLTRKGTYRFHRDAYDPHLHPFRHLAFDATRTLTVMFVGTTLGLGLLAKGLRRRHRL